MKQATFTSSTVSWDREGNQPVPRKERLMEVEILECLNGIKLAVATIMVINGINLMINIAKFINK